MIILAIDPGNEQSAYCIYDTKRRAPVAADILPNQELLHKLDSEDAPWLAIEMVASYGMPVGRTVFETCLWVGRFVERFRGRHILVYRPDVKLYLCNSVRAKDSNVGQVLLDRYGGTRRAALGTKKQPGPLYGFKYDMWSALAVAITAAETADVLEGGQ